jgi:hypothetical protein
MSRSLPGEEEPGRARSLRSSFTHAMRPPCWLLSLAFLVLVAAQQHAEEEDEEAGDPVKSYSTER